MGCGAAEATGRGLVLFCFVVINPRVLLANRVDLGFFLFHKLSYFTPILLPPPPVVHVVRRRYVSDRQHRVGLGK